MDAQVNPESYLNDRLQSEIKWYGGYAVLNKWLHVGTRGIEIVCAAVIPLLAGLSGPEPRLRIVTGVLGVVVAVAAGFSSLLKFQENWIKYRLTAEALKREKYLYLTQVEPYNGSNSFSTLVQRVEALVSRENSGWENMMSAAQGEKKT